MRGNQRSSTDRQSVMAADAHPYLHTLFDTAVGRCALVWSERGLAALQLPESDDEATLKRLRRGRGGVGHLAVPEGLALRVIDGVNALLGGERDDLADVLLDLEGIPPFHGAVYAESRRILPGQTMTYGELASRLGGPAAARAVGQALGDNPFAIVVPCHRVLAAGGRSGGFSAGGGVSTKLRLLTLEGARFGAEPGLFDGQ
jgi:methylated-DNA-[protein]-cysteine S-methyltransferase